MIPEVKSIVEVEEKKEKIEEKIATDDIYEFKEPEPFEFETRSKLTDEKSLKKRLTPRLFEDMEKSPKKKGSRSPTKPETPEKRSRRTPVKSDDEEKKVEDPFDKLVESPSFHIVKSVEKTDKPKVVKNINLEEPFNLFKDLEEDADVSCVERLDIPYNDESQSQPLFSSNEDNIFSDSFVKTVSDCTVLNQDCLGFKDERKKDSDDDETLRLKDTIHRITQASMTDEEESSDGIVKKEEMVELKFTPFGVVEMDKATLGESSVKEAPKMISPALQETDTNLLKSIYEPQPELLATKLEETKEISLKTGAKVAESILQKFNMLKNQQSEVKTEAVDPKPQTDEDDSKRKVKPEQKAKKVTKAADSKVKPAVSKVEKRNRKYVSPEFVDSDSDSSDSEQLVIARSDDDSQTNFETKPDLKESDSNISFFHSVDDSRSQDFKFEPLHKKEPSSPERKPENEEPDSNLHSLLLCEETIPGSPAPAVEATQPPPEKPRNKALMEMPFASVPSSSNTKNVVVSSGGTSNMNVPQKEKVVVPFVLPPENREPHETNTVLDNTPPTTPESSISNLSPRGLVYLSESLVRFKFLYVCLARTVVCLHQVGIMIAGSR